MNKLCTLILTPNNNTCLLSHTPLVYVLWFSALSLIVTGFVTTITQRTCHTLNSIQRSIRRMSVIPVHVTLTHKLHVHILHGTSLEPKQMHLNL